MVYRDEREALHQRALAAENEVAALRKEAERARHLERRVDHLERELAVHRPARPSTPRRQEHPARIIAFVTLGAMAVGGGWYALGHGHRGLFGDDGGGFRGRQKAKLTATVTRTQIPSEVAFKPQLERAPVTFTLGRSASALALWGQCGDRGTTLGLRGVDASTGQTLWTACNLALSYHSDANALDAGEMIAVWIGRAFVAIDARTGKEKWRALAPGSITGACVHGANQLSAELDDGRIWEANLETRQATSVDLAAAGCRPEPRRDDWSSAGRDPSRRVVDASSLPDGQLPRLEIGEGNDKARMFDVTRAGPVPGGTLALGLHQGRPAVAFVEASTPKWARDLPLPDGVNADGTTPAIALADEHLVFVAYQPAREVGLRIASLSASTGALLWSAPVGKPEWTLHAVNGLAVDGAAIFVREPWHLYALSRTDGSARFDLP